VFHPLVIVPGCCRDGDSTLLLTRALTIVHAGRSEIDAALLLTE
jgi:hypothetical protein